MGGNKSDVDVVNAKPVLVTPGIGRIVHFVGAPAVPGHPEVSGHYPADVVRSNINGTLMLYVKNPDLRVAEFVDQIPEDPTGNSPHTWHWPERL